jgi:hypothetical protein
LVRERRAEHHADASDAEATGAVASCIAVSRDESHRQRLSVRRCWASLRARLGAAVHGFEVLVGEGLSGLAEIGCRMRVPVHHTLLGCRSLCDHEFLSAATVRRFIES